MREHAFDARGQTRVNLLLDLPGNTAGVPIAIGAHFVAVPNCTGSDDNATGVAVLLELARAVAAEPLASPVRCIAFDMEEYGLLGSRSYAAALQQQGAALSLMSSLEMLGYCDRAAGSQRYPKFALILSVARGFPSPCG
ncbi:M28 family peptidase [Rubidibacter lacunae]|uniref:M28 family peptidase n=1 Tax=Rubidibacter lacunae TaxID=582514 RepID=UPI00040EA5F9|nr:M28 family peptidase [Rubidibacter lacunae]